VVVIFLRRRLVFVTLRWHEAESKTEREEKRKKGKEREKREKSDRQNEEEANPLDGYHW
jgi:hypothetical protein